MKKSVLVLSVVLMLALAGCSDNKSIEQKDGSNQITFSGSDVETHQGDGYTINISEANYQYEKETDDGAIEETWEHKKYDDVEIKVTTYKNTDQQIAVGKFLQDNDDYIVEDLMGYPVCGMDEDADVLWFDLKESNGTVYIISWEYPANTSEKLQKNLPYIANTFKLAD